MCWYRAGDAKDWLHSRCHQIYRASSLVLPTPQRCTIVTEGKEQVTHNNWGVFIVPLGSQLSSDRLTASLHLWPAAESKQNKIAVHHANKTLLSAFLPFFLLDFPCFSCSSPFASLFFLSALVLPFSFLSFLSLSLSTFCISFIYYGNFHFPLSFSLPIVWSCFFWKSLLYSSVFLLILHYRCFSSPFLGMCTRLFFPFLLPPVSHFSVFILSCMVNVWAGVIFKDDSWMKTLKTFLFNEITTVLFFKLLRRLFRRQFRFEIKHCKASSDVIPHQPTACASVPEPRSLTLPFYRTCQLTLHALDVTRT